MNLLALLLFMMSVAAPEADERGDFFESRIRPLLTGNCYSCHQADAKSGLRLDSRQGILKGGSRGSAIAPGKPEESLLIQAVSHTHATLKMPPPGKLSDDEIADLTRWIRDGAYWPESPSEFFATRVRPILVKNCLSCHIGDSAQGGLRLESRQALLGGGVSGPAVVPGDPDNSLLIQSVRYAHAVVKMPPDKALSDSEIADLASWVKSGAVWSDSTADTPGTDYVITPAQKAFWSFQPPAKSPLPSVKLKAWARHPIDHFILAKLEEKGLKPAPPADRRTLIRRATYDLVGLPPKPEEVEGFLKDQSPNAFEKVVDRLLASPHYGERWGRHWLDLVRYADTAGDSSDYPVPQAYLYRDYVIDSLNRDKPYDQFIREQIAGDLLPGRSDEERWQRVIATGYLAISRRFSVRPERNMHLTIEDTIDNLGKAFLGLSLGCARCHDHKYDPISMKDYYGLYGIFDSTRYPFAGSENVQEQQDLVPRLAPSHVEALLKPFKADLDLIDEEIKRLEQERTALQAQPATVTDKVDVPDKQEKQVTRTADEIRAEINKLNKLRKSIRGKMPEIEMAFAVAEGTPRNGRVQRRGDPRNLGEEVPRRFLQILGGHELPSWARGSGRLQLADWLVDSKNPLVGRVMVNRIWQHHFGKGIVATASDFGFRGRRPTHADLLDYLAVEFMERGWSIKAMHRMMMLSSAYQMSSRHDEKKASVDPANDFLWRFNRRRLDAESMRDSMLLVSGQLDTNSRGPHAFPHPSTWTFTQHRPFADVYESNRRSVYLMTQRIQKHPYFAIFDGADTNLSTAERLVTTTPIQALFMMNSPFVHDQADRLAQKLISEFPQENQQVDRAHRVVLGRPATPEELEKGADYLQKAQAALASRDVPVVEKRAQALASYVRALFSSNEFLFVD